MLETNFGFKGLSDSEVLVARAKFGLNQLEFKKMNPVIKTLLSLAKEPMILLLLSVSIIYFIIGNYSDGIFLSLAILLVASISLYQDARSKRALSQLRDFTQPNCKVIRNRTLQEIKREELVIGDFLVVEEGNTISADGTILHSNDFSVIESVLTGESHSVFKDVDQLPEVKMGTTVTGGLAIVEVTKIGNETDLGKIGISMESIDDTSTPLELQIKDFVKKMVYLGVLVFIAVWVISYFQTKSILDSLLNALTLAMSILPEEIPVAFTTFMALGSWRLMKLGVIVKQMKTVETLGSATVICTDKTGTITENKMSLAKLFLLANNKTITLSESLNPAEKELVEIAMWASEPMPFDPMEIALHEAYSKSTLKDERKFYKMLHEYPLSGKPPMMTHFFENESGKRIIAAKGAPEAFLPLADLTETEQRHYLKAVDDLANQGFRVLGVGYTLFEGNDFLEKQQDYKFKLLGIVAFYDPPKANIQKVFQSFYDAKIDVKIITGDNAATTAAIANQVNFKGAKNAMSGEELITLSDVALQNQVKETQIFTRMFPSAKLKIINALKANGEIVAMTGDGVNDGPALKAAHIGIAMGKKGTEIAKEAASLILLEDDLSKMLDAIAMGRKIYSNLKKAIRYIISIHIPIILMVFIPLALGWIYPNIFLPMHVILLELIMGPTCSIIYENEPIEKNIMHQKPRLFTDSFFNRKELIVSVIQGLMITAGTLAIYQISVYNGLNEATTRAMVFTTLIVSNIFLTLVNRSFYFSIFTTLQYKNKLVPIIIGATILMLGLMLFVPPITAFFKLQQISFNQILVSIGIGSIAALWFEIAKWIRRKRG